MVGLTALAAAIHELVGHSRPDCCEMAEVTLRYFADGVQLLINVTATGVLAVPFAGSYYFLRIDDY